MSLGELLGTTQQSHADQQFNQAQGAYNAGITNTGGATGGYQNLLNEGEASLPGQTFIPTPNVPGYNGSQGYYQATGPTTTPGTYGAITNQGTTQYNTATSALPGLIGEYEAATGLPGPAGTVSPYTMTAAQRLALNTQIDQLNQSQNTALNDINAAYNARGITDPSQTAAAQALIRQNYGSAVAGQTAAFQNAAAQTAATGAENLINYNAGQQQQGTAQQETGIGGANALVEAGSGGLGATGNTLFGASGQQNTASNQSQQSANAATGSLLQLLGASAGYTANSLGGGSGSSGNANTTSPSQNAYNTQANLQNTDTIGTPVGNSILYTTPSARAISTATAPVAGTAPVLAVNPFNNATYGVNAFNGGVSTGGGGSNIFGGNGTPGYGQGANS